MQIVRSYKIRGAYNKIASLSPEELARGVVCASAGNHAQGVALACSKLGIMGTIFMPKPTPNQKIHQVKMFGKDNVNIVLTGDTYDDSCAEALAWCREHDGTFIHPFNDPQIRPPSASTYSTKPAATSTTSCSPSAAAASCPASAAYSKASAPKPA